eukprot:jgi/Hompol1/48/HPOL_002428-RA
MRSKIPSTAPVQTDVVSTQRTSSRKSDTDTEGPYDADAESNPTDDSLVIVERPASGIEVDFEYADQLTNTSLAFGSDVNLSAVPPTYGHAAVSSEDLSASQYSIERQPAQNQPTPLIVEVFESIFTPGLSPRVQMVMHIAFAVLTLNFAALLILSDFNLHVVVLLVVSGLLWATTTWFLGVVQEIKTTEQPKHEEASESTGAETETLTKNEHAEQNAPYVEFNKDQ